MQSVGFPIDLALSCSFILRFWEVALHFCPRQSGCSHFPKVVSMLAGLIVQGRVEDARDTLLCLQNAVSCWDDGGVTPEERVVRRLRAKLQGGPGQAASTTGVSYSF